MGWDLQLRRDGSLELVTELFGLRTELLETVFCGADLDEASAAPHRMWRRLLPGRETPCPLRRAPAISNSDSHIAIIATIAHLELQAALAKACQHLFHLLPLQEQNKGHVPCAKRSCSLLQSFSWLAHSLFLAGCGLTPVFTKSNLSCNVQVSKLAHRQARDV